MPLFWQKHILIEAKKLTAFNWDEITEWIHVFNSRLKVGTIIRSNYPSSGDVPVLVMNDMNTTSMVEIGDWIVRGPRGHFSVYQQNLFDQLYEKDKVNDG